MTPARFLARASISAVAVLLAAEVVLAVADRALPDPVDFYNETAHAKAIQMEEIAREEHGTDIVFIGPSTVYRGIDVDLFEREDTRGRSAYNAGVQGGYPPIMRRWAREEVVPRLRPRIVVYGLSTLDFHDRIFRGSVGAYRTARATRRDLWGAGDRALSSISRVFKYRNLLHDPTEYPYVQRVVTRGEPDRVDRRLRELSPGGFAPKAPVPPRERDRKDRAILSGFRIGVRGTKAVTATVEDLQAQGIEVVFVEMPAPDRFVALHPRGRTDLRMFQRHIQGLAEDLGVELHSPPPQLRNGGLFADNAHYNARGARAFTLWLASELATS